MSLSATTEEQLLTDPAQFVRQKIREFVRTDPSNRLSFLDGYEMWAEPQVNFASGDDPLFAEFKSIIAPVHLTPREALANAYGKTPDDMPAQLSVISWILPIAEETRKSNRTETRVCSRLWSHTRWHGEKANEKLREYVVELLNGLGYLAVAPSIPPYVKTFNNEKGMYSNWSERHIAYAAGHGTFSLSDGFITEHGIAHRCASVVTSLVLPASRRTAESPYSNCLFYVGVNCRACIERCPAGAITEQGHDKKKCQKYLNDIGYQPALFSKNGYDNDKSVAGCGLCQTKVPCEFRNPAKSIKKKTNL